MLTVVLHLASCGGAAPTQLKPLTGVVFVSAAANHTCTVMTDGTAKCWGDNNYYELGNDQKLGSVWTPLNVMGLTNVAAIAAGGQHVCT
ncbi:MAG TPA: hypothetical protein VG713_05310 [Pirellulales bacterium]|nr:hypothetical protein [Pirellulales bacterium]